MSHASERKKRSHGEVEEDESHRGIMPGCARTDRSLDHAQERRSGCCCRGRSRAGSGGGAGRVSTAGAGVRPDGIRMLLVMVRLLALELDLVLHFVAVDIFVVVDSVVATDHRLRLLLLLRRLPLLHHLLHNVLFFAAEAAPPPSPTNLLAPTLPLLACVCMPLEPCSDAPPPFPFPVPPFLAA
uniref:Uncharacterized protein n=1 Tax=Zea mays TaxID=4577 RepID=C0PC76_MAIZE|nr:unknown [Zea mays]|eukprot:NP_001169150.1 uncharacterized protein LOC100382996 [Zea mays]